MLSEGKNVAFVTDAGTPGVSDPGNMLVREARNRGIPTIPIPGASALATLLSVCGEDVQKFVFLAFPPHKKGRETFFRTLAEYTLPVAFYESSHRILKSLHSLAETVPERRIVVGRELTKMFEELVHGSPAEVEAYFTDHPMKVKGEFVVLVVV
jgi:16S rRNA (cytidine1402-2'-O)-methyltransferase